MEVYNPEKARRSRLTKAAIIVGVGGLLGFIIGRLWGAKRERDAQAARRRWRYDSDSSRKIKRRHARDWDDGLLRSGRFQS
jgi:hypothetical protein